MKRRTEGTAWRRLVMGLLVALSHGEVARAEIHSNLQVRYRLDDLTGQTATDSSTNTGRNGTLTNGAQFISSGRIGGAVDLAGDDDFIDCPAITATDGAQRLTAAFWLNTDSRADSEVVLSKYLDVNNGFSIQFGASGTGDNDDLLVTIATSSTSGYVYTTGNVLGNGTWIHVAVVYDDSASLRL